MGGGGAENAAFVRQWGSPAWFFFYLGNFRIAYKHAWPTIAGYGPLWSLQIEEQFYLLLPLAVRWMRLENLTRLLWGMVLLSPVMRILFFLHDPGNPFPQFVLLPCHMEGLALGALIAVRFRSGPWALHKGLLAALAFALLTATCIASFVGKPILVDQLWSSPFNLLAGISLSSWGCASLVLLLIALRGSSYTRPLRAAPIAYLAQISYGIYLLHRLVSRFTRWLGNSGLHLPPDGFARFLVVVGLSILLASLSWYAFERPLARLKERIAPSRQPDRAPAAT
jgi:peptidoglycan/LPS O-acetylase OafA/YrhL